MIAQLWRLPGVAPESRGILYYLLRPDTDDEKGKQRSGGAGAKAKIGAEKLDMDSLDEEDKKLLAEVVNFDLLVGRLAADSVQPLLIAIFF